jgi:hypothetical protein
MDDDRKPDTGPAAAPTVEVRVEHVVAALEYISAVVGQLNGVVAGLDPQMVLGRVPTTAVGSPVLAGRCKPAPEKHLA